MSDSFDRAVRAGIGLGILACAVAAVEVREAPLPPAARAHWATPGTAAFRHVAGRTFAIDATAAGGERERRYAGAPVTVRAGQPLAIRGWAFDPATQHGADRLVFRVDAGPWRDAAYHLPRPDVAAAFGLPGTVDSGFRAELAAGVLAPGAHRVRLATVTGTAPLPIPAPVSVVVRGR